MKQNAFTLAELLIALLVLGVIATFTIPKVLQSQQSSQYSSMAKEVAGMLVNSITAYEAENGLANSNTSISDLTPYMNYVASIQDNTIEINVPWNGGGQGNGDCGGVFRCLSLHNGGLLRYRPGHSLCDYPNGAIRLAFDPSAKFDSVDGVGFFLYGNKRIRTSAEIPMNQGFGNGEPCSSTTNPDPSNAADWFSWD